MKKFIDSFILLAIMPSALIAFVVETKFRVNLVESGDWKWFIFLISLHLAILGGSLLIGFYFSWSFASILYPTGILAASVIFQKSLERLESL